MCEVMCFVKSSFNWVSAVSPTLGCSIEISHDIYVYVCRYVNLPTILWETHTKKNVCQNVWEELRNPNTRMLLSVLGV